MNDHAAPAEHDWDAQAEWYDTFVNRLEPEFCRVSEAMLAAAGVGPGTRLLDLACGGGHSTAAAKALGAKALGLDLSAAIIAAARRRFPDVDFQVGDMLEPPAGPWDATICRFGAHHEDDAWMHAVQNVLVGGGHMVLAEFDATDDEAVRNGMRPPSFWLERLAAAGFVDIETHAVMLRLGRLLEGSPELAAEAGEGAGHLQDGPVHIFVGRTPMV